MLWLACTIALTPPSWAHSSDVYPGLSAVKSPVPDSSPSPLAAPLNVDSSISQVLNQRTRQHHQQHKDLARWMMPHKLEPIVFPARRVRAEQPFNRGLTALHRQAYKKAVRDFARAVRIDPTYEKAWMHQGDAYMQLGNYQQAIASYDQAIDLHKTFSRLYRTHLRSQEGAASRFSISLTKQRLILVVA
jgi:anthranilate/para-aminobenzoate synthase component I